MGAVKKAKEDAKQKAKLAKAKKKLMWTRNLKISAGQKAFLQKQKAAERKVQQAEGESINSEINSRRNKEKSVRDRQSDEGVWR